MEDGDVLKVGNMELKILHTPGHTLGGISILVGNVLFSGDTLFADSHRKNRFQRRILSSAEGIRIYEAFRSARRYACPSGAYGSDEYRSREEIESVSVRQRYSAGALVFRRRAALLSERPSLYELLLKRREPVLFLPSVRESGGRIRIAYGIIKDEKIYHLPEPV